MTCGYGSIRPGSAALRALAAGKGAPSKGAAAVLTSVSSLPGSRPEKSTSRSARSADASTSPSGGTRAGVRSSPWSVPIWVIRWQFGFTVVEQHQPVGAGVGAVEDAEAVGGRLHLQQRPDLAVDDREGRKGLHHLRVGLMDQLAGQPPGAVEAEVAVLDQQRHLERRPLGQAEFALALVADDPQPRQPGVDAEPGDAHHVVVVPQQRRPLAHRVVEDGVLAGREEVFGPAVIRRRDKRRRADARPCDRPVRPRSGRACRRSGPGHTAPARRWYRLPWERSSRQPATRRPARSVRSQ